MKTTYYTFLAGIIDRFHLLFGKNNKYSEPLFEPFMASLARIENPKSAGNEEFLSYYKRTKELGYEKPTAINVNYLVAEICFATVGHDPMGKVSLKMNSQNVLLAWCYTEEFGGEGKVETVQFDLPKDLKLVDDIANEYIKAVYQFADAYDTRKKQKSIKKLLRMDGSVTDKGAEICAAFIAKNSESELRSILLSQFEDLGFSELLVRKLKEEAKKENLLQILQMGSINDFQQFKQFGTKPAKELREFLEKNELDFGMFTT